MITDLGKIGMTVKGIYSESKTYERLDVVTKNGQSYVCLKDCMGIEVSNEEYWQLLAQKGDMPIKGVDYLTQTEKEEFKNDVINQSQTDLADFFVSEEEKIQKNLSDKKDELQAEFDNNVVAKTKEYNDNTDVKTKTFNDNVIAKTNEFDNNTTVKIEEYNNNTVAKIKKYNDNANAQMKEYDNNAELRTTIFNENATAKTNEFNVNVTTQTNTFNSNASDKLEEYNNNTIAKTEEFNNNVERYKKELEELAEQMPWDTTQIQESIQVHDSAKYSRNKLELFGDIKQETREGHNLLGINDTEESIVNDVNCSCNDEIITLNGTASALTTLFSNINYNIPKSGTYTFQIIPISGKWNNGSIGVRGRNSLNTQTWYKQIQYNKQELFLTGDIELQDTSLVQLFCTADSVFNNFKFKFQFLEGAYTNDTLPPFEQYGTMPSIEYPSIPQVVTGVQKIRRCGKNWFDYSLLIEETNGGITLSKTDTGFSAKGTAIANYVYFNKVKCKLKAKNKYIFNCKSNNRVFLWLWSKGVIVKSIQFINKATTFETLENIDYITLGAEGLTIGNNYDFEVSDIQIEKIEQENDTATEYEPYTSKEYILDLKDIELCKITDSNNNVIVQDRFVYRNNKWQIEKNVEKIILDGSETWRTSFVAGSINTVRFARTITSSASESYNNLFKTRIGGSHTDTEYFCLLSVNLYVNINIDRLTDSTVESFQDWLSTNNLIFYRVAPTPTYIECTQEQSDILDKLCNLQLQKGTNNIFIESEYGLTAQMRLTYMQDRAILEKAIQDRITAIENLLSTTTTSAMLLDNLQTDLESEVK